jgi:hypothetical protein
MQRIHLSELPWSPWVNGIVGLFKDESNFYLMLKFILSGCFYDVIPNPHLEASLSVWKNRFQYLFFLVFCAQNLYVQRCFV